jgi:hypothetical protein
MLRPPALAALVALATCAACGAPGRAARIGTRPDGGSIMLSANNDKAWESAKELMSNHCDGKYRVVAQVQEGGALAGVWVCGICDGGGGEAFSGTGTGGACRGPDPPVPRSQL